MTEMDRLVEALSNSPALQRTLLVEPIDTAFAAARDAGYAVTREEFATYRNARQNGRHQELSDAQLDSIAGGRGLTRGRTTS